MTAPPNDKTAFNTMLLRGTWKLAFIHGEPATDSEFQNRLRPATPDIGVELHLRVTGTPPERAEFRTKLRALLGDEVPGEFSGNTSTFIIPAEVTQKLLEYGVEASIAHPPSRMIPPFKIQTSIEPSLCERVTVSYHGEQKGAVNDAFAAWLKSGFFTLSREIAGKLVPESTNKELALNLEALQYFVEHGSNRKEVYSPTR